MIETKLENPEEKGKRVADLFDALLLQYNEFPDTETMSFLARRVQASLWGLDVAAVHADPDAALLKWVSTEYRLFRIFEEREFQCAPKDVLGSLQGMLGYANSLLNRRKSRAGKSLEHHLAHLFTMENLRFEEQVKTEGNKKPDFIFPDGVSYHNLLFPDDGLTFLGAKTTCKDRWRQVLNEAGRISHKHLFTLQEGISANQLEEMINENLTLVVPATNIKTFDRRYQGRIMTLSGFITMVETKQRKYAT